MQIKQMKTICRLAWPAIVQEALNVVVTYVDTAMVGALGATASAAVGLTGTVGWLVSSLAIAFGVGVLSVCAQADGAHDTAKLQRAGQQALFITIVVGLVLTIVCVSISPFLPIWLNGDPEIRNDAFAYFLIVSIPLLFRTAILILSSALRGVRDMKTPMMINLYINLINIVFNYFLIYPTHTKWGITIPCAGLGVKGAAIATAISYVVGGILMFIRYYHNSIFDFKHTGFHIYKKELKECLHISVPVVMERSVICLGHVTFSSLIAQLGVISFAAHTIAIQAEQAFYIPGYGFQSAAATLVGNAVGEKHQKKVEQTTYTICGMTFSLMLIAGFLLFVFADNLMAIFTPDLEVVALGASVLRIVSVSEPIYGVLVIMEGTFNGMGETKEPFLYALLTMWGIRVLGTWIIITWLHLGLQFVWIMMVLDNVARCLLLAYRFFKKKWRYLLER